MIELENGRFSARIDPLGAQIVSFREGERELLWTGDPAYWAGQAPVLFPIVGALRQGRAKIKGQWVEMAQHGFARRRVFALNFQTESAASLTLRADEDTKKQYPFDFALTVDYGLTEEGYFTQFAVENTGDEPLPFSIGGHPGFNLPMEDGARFEDYTIQFEKDEDQKCPAVAMGAGLLDYETVGFTLKGREIPLKHSLFYKDALVFENLNSRRVRILNKKTGRGLEMYFGSEFPMLGIWSAANDGPYVCLEPWTGCATLTTEGDEFTQKHNMQAIAPGEKYSYSFSVKVLG